jgi:predicted TIM-barrel enzyme
MRLKKKVASDLVVEMIKKSLGDCIPLEFDEIPSLEALTHTVERLRKDAKILTGIKSKKEVSPESLIQVANFLESLGKR